MISWKLITKGKSIFLELRKFYITILLLSVLFIIRLEIMCRLYVNRETTVEAETNVSVSLRMEPCYFVVVNDKITNQ